MTIAELIVKIVFQTNNPQALPQVEKGLKDSAREAALFAAGINVVNAALFKMVNLGRDAALALTNFRLQTGGDTTQLQRWQGALEAQHVSGEDTLKLFRNIKDAQAAVRLGTGNVAAFQAFGLDANEQDTGKFLNQVVRVANSNLDPNIQRQFTQMLGITDDMFAAFKRVNFEKDAISENLILSPDQIRQLADFDKEWMKMKRDLTGVALQLAVDLRPAFETVVHAIQSLVNKGREFSEWLRRPENEQYRASLQRMVVALLALGAVLPVVAAALLAFATIPFTPEIAGMVTAIILLAGAFDTLAKGIAHPVQLLKDMVDAVKFLIASNFIRWISGLPDHYQGAELSDLAKAGIAARGGGGRTVNVTNHNTVTIDGAMQPAETARHVRGVFDDLHMDAFANTPAFSF